MSRISCVGSAGANEGMLVLSHVPRNSCTRALSSGSSTSASWLPKMVWVIGSAFMQSTMPLP